jgi:hypothetical protein
MSKGVKVHESIRKWDGYALFDKDNVLVSDRLYSSIYEAEPDMTRIRFWEKAEGVSIWNVTLTRKDKVNDHNAVKV